MLMRKMTKSEYNKNPNICAYSKCNVVIPYDKAMDDIRCCCASHGQKYRHEMERKKREEERKMIEQSKMQEPTVVTPAVVTEPKPVVTPTSLLEEWLKDVELVQSTPLPGIHVNCVHIDHMTLIINMPGCTKKEDIS